MHRVHRVSSTLGRTIYVLPERPYDHVGRRVRGAARVGQNRVVLMAIQAWEALGDSMTGGQHSRRLRMKVKSS
jgi:hypothetical protein